MAVAAASLTRRARHLGSFHSAYLDERRLVLLIDADDG
jgi:hypothetical protein